MIRIVCALTVIVLLASAMPLDGQDRETKVRNDRVRFQRDDRWIYNDLPAAYERARQTGRPLLVVFRCIPCEACSEFDEQVIEEREGLDDLLDKFVCARVVHANGLDLSLFQFDFDQSFHAILMNADRAIYGRFGTRSHRPEKEDMSLAGFRAALQRALELHAQYPGNREALASKRKSPATTVARPEDFPALKGKYGPTLDYEGKVVQSCIHCHQVREAERAMYRAEGKSIPAEVLYPYPLPDVVGLTMSAEEPATIQDVADGSPAAIAGLEAGDRILEFAGQPLLSTADVQWVLHHAGDSAELPLEVQRQDATRRMTMNLPAGWRMQSDLSWRPTTWDLRRMATGGLVLDPIAADERPDGIAAERLALRVKHVGQYGEHAVAKHAGFQKGDVITAVDGRSEPMTETQFIAYGLGKAPGENLRLSVRRGRQQLELVYPVQ